jgi:hypothetical protein
LLQALRQICGGQGLTLELLSVRQWVWAIARSGLNVLSIVDVEARQQ